MNEQAGTKIYSNGIKLSGIHINDSLPVNISTSLLKVNDVDVFITNDTIKQKSNKTFSINLKWLKENKDIFASFSIDTIDFDVMNLKIHSLKNLPEKTGKLDSIGMLIEGIRINSSMADMANPEIIDQVNIDLNGKTLITADSLYKISSGIIHYNFISQHWFGCVGNRP